MPTIAFNLRYAWVLTIALATERLYDTCIWARGAGKASWLGCDPLHCQDSHPPSFSSCLEAALSKSVLTNACAAYPVVEVLRFLGQAYDT
jgi:hypothetical protein